MQNRCHVNRVILSEVIGSALQDVILSEAEGPALQSVILSEAEGPALQSVILSEAEGPAFAFLPSTIPALALIAKPRDKRKLPRRCRADYLPIRHGTKLRVHARVMDRVEQIIRSCAHFKRTRVAK